MNFIGSGKKLDDIDLPKIGQLIGVGEDEIHAILDVESLGGGFDRLNRPKMLFEPHIFYRQLVAHMPEQLTKAIVTDLAYKSWGTRPYPTDSYPIFFKASEINQELAIRSSSWGLGQLMGFNFSMAGYSSAESMVTYFIEDEEIQLRGMIKFIIASGLDDELRAHDWVGFARGYNGPGFARNGYDKKLAAAYARWKKIKDTPIK